MIKRLILPTLKKYLTPGKVVVLYGPRQSGKTTLLHTLSHQLPSKPLFLNGEDHRVQSWLSSQNSSIIKPYLDSYEYILIDEAQNIPHIGQNLKLIIDSFPKKQLLVTGSSSFELANQVGEPLVGRQWQFQLYPLAQIELQTQEDYLTTKSLLHQRLLYGSYPEVITTTNLEKKQKLLDQIIDHHLFKDILALENLKKPKKLLSLLRLLAFQIGQEVSLSELGNQLNMSFHTVERYLDLLEKSWIIINISGFSRNLRKEVTKNHRYYFIDNGVRNAIIQNFNSLELRNDIGQLWENYLFIERLKKQSYQGWLGHYYFWRTYDQKELDLVEESGGQLAGFEFKWSNRKKPKAPQSWLKTYDNSTYQVISQDNYLEFIA